MKKMDIFCASPASTAVRSSLDDRRSIDRHNPHIHDRRRRSGRGPMLCSSQLPIFPRSASYHQKTSGNKQNDMRRKSSADIGDLTSPPGSSRYLLSDTPLFEFLSDSVLVSSQSTSVQQVSSKDVVLVSSEIAKTSRLSASDAALVPSEVIKIDAAKIQRLSSSGYGVVPSQNRSRSCRIVSNDSPSLNSSSARCRDQVVVLRVGLHCKGCEGKVRKHIARMEGVRSFNIDLATKKVTIIGDVTPLGVLTSVSRVKRAQFWPSSSVSSSSSSSPVSLSSYQ